MFKIIFNKRNVLTLSPKLKQMQVRKDFNYIVVEGNIGAGKTTLTKMIANQFDAELILEKFADNPFLPKFYNDQDKYAFQLETSFLIERYNQLKNQIQTFELFKKFSISDYYFPKTLIFAKYTLKKDEYDLFRKIFDTININVPRPDLYVYLHLPVEKLITNIKKRGRDYEKNITPEYLKKIQDSYLSYFKTQTKMKFLVINTRDVDFVSNKNDYKKITDIIFLQKYNKNLTIITP